MLKKSTCQFVLSFSLIFSLTFILTYTLFGAGFSTSAHAAVIDEWSFQSTTATSGTGSNEVDSSYSTSAIDETITLGGARINSTTTANFSIFDSSLNINGFNVSTTGDGAFINLYGGYAESTVAGPLSVTNNSISIANSTISTTGAFAFTGFVEVEINLYGGYAESTAAGAHIVTNNSISIANSIISTSGINSIINLYGGYARSTAAGAHIVTNNSITVTNSTISTTALNALIELSGGFAFGNGNHELTNNTLNIMDNTTISTAGDNAFIKLSGGLAFGNGNHELTNNILNIMDNTTISTAGVDASITLSGGRVGGKGNFVLNNNSLNIVNSTVKSTGARGTINLSGATTDDGTDGDHELTNNSLRVVDSTIITEGELASITLSGGAVTGNTGRRTATNNSLSIVNSNISIAGNYISPVVGAFFGLALSGGYASSDGNGQQVTNNSLSIANSNMSTTGNSSSPNESPDILIYGGYAASLAASTDHKVTHNTVTLSGNVNATTADANIRLAGGFIDVIATGDARTGNTLVLDVATVKLVAGDRSSSDFSSTVQNFENYVFKPSFAQMSGGLGNPMLSANNIDLGNNARLNLNHRIHGTGTVLPIGQEFTLLKADTALTGNFINIGETHTLNQGISIAYALSTVQTINGVGAGEVTARVSGRSSQDQAKVPSEAKLGTLAMLNQGGDLASGSGMDNAVYATKKQDNVWKSFSALSAGNSRYETGSYIDLAGFSLLSGIARRFETAQSNFVIGAFFEYGQANLNTHNSFDNSADIQGTGETEYVGGGILGRFDHNSGVYADATFRIGSARTEHSSSDYAGYLGQDISYDNNNIYYAAHAALGYNLQIAESGNLDIYAKYYWTHLGEGEATLAGDKFEFDAINSSRIRAGAKYTHAINEYVSPYLGAAYEYEFDSYAKSSVHGLDIDDAPNLKGSTGIFEAGISLSPIKDVPVYIDLGLEGFIGKRQGYLGKLQFVFEF